MDLRNWLFLVEDIPLTGDLWFLCSVLPWMGGWAHHGIHGKIFTVTKNITSGRLISKKYRICDLSWTLVTHSHIRIHTFDGQNPAKQLTLWYLIIWDVFRPSQMVQYVTFASGFWQVQSECFKLTTESFSVFFAFPRLLPKPPPPRRKKMKTGKWLDFLME